MAEIVLEERWPGLGDGQTRRLGPSAGTLLNPSKRTTPVVIAQGQERRTAAGETLDLAFDDQQSSQT